jgi:allantoicase
MPGRAVNMSDGWATRRRRGPGHDWSVVRLAAQGEISRIEVDTNHFKGNFPDTCSIEACLASEAGDAVPPDAAWKTLLPRTKLQAHTRHFFETELAQLGPSSHVRLSVYPDGGVSRLRVFGTLGDDARASLGVRRLDALPGELARADLTACAASTRWVDAMLAARPFGTAKRVYEIAERAWSQTGPEDWRQAIAAHPRIGESAAPKEAGTQTGWSSKEQAGMRAASTEVRAKMSEANRLYESRFGFTYIVCATGKSAEELLAIAESRLQNSPEKELETAAAELYAITLIRLGKLLQP